GGGDRDAAWGQAGALAQRGLVPHRRAGGLIPLRSVGRLELVLSEMPGTTAGVPRSRPTVAKFAPKTPLPGGEWVRLRGDRRSLMFSSLTRPVGPTSPRGRGEATARTLAST